MDGVMHQGTRKLLRPGNTWLYWVLSKETPRSHCMKLERQNQSCRGDSSVLEIPGTQDIHQLKLQTQGTVSLRQRLCVTGHKTGEMPMFIGAHVMPSRAQVPDNMQICSR